MQHTVYYHFRQNYRPARRVPAWLVSLWRWL